MQIRDLPLFPSLLALLALGLPAQAVERDPNGRSQGKRDNIGSRENRRTKPRRGVRLGEGGRASAKFERQVGSLGVTVQSLRGTNRTFQAVYVDSRAFNFELTDRFWITEMTIMHYNSMLLFYIILSL